VTSARATLLLVPLALLVACAHPAWQSADNPSGPGAQRVSVESPDLGLLSTLLFEETNRARVENGIKPLMRSPQLEAAADDQAFHTALLFHAEHINPLPGEHSPADRVAREGLLAETVTENALMIPARLPGDSGRGDTTYRQLARLIIESWMGSPGHRVNLLDPHVTFVGCAARMSHGPLGDWRVFAVQDFYLPARGDPNEPVLSENVK
jgi:uncharacterized protein YkwD